jgi:hypothetical protein
MSEIDLLDKVGGRERAALAGWLVGVLSTLGYTIFYQRVQGGASAVLFKVVFFYISAMDSLARWLEPNFSLTFSLLYSFKFASLGFLFMLVYLGLLGAGFGLLLWSLYGQFKKQFGPTSQ